MRLRLTYTGRYYEMSLGLDSLVIVKDRKSGQKLLEDTLPSDIALSMLGADDPGPGDVDFTCHILQGRPKLQSVSQLQNLIIDAFQILLKADGKMPLTGYALKQAKKMASRLILELIPCDRTWPTSVAMARLCRCFGITPDRLARSLDIGIGSILDLANGEELKRINVLLKDVSSAAHP